MEDLSSSSTERPQTCVRLSARKFRLCWISMITFHLTCMLFALVAGMAHVLFGQPKLYENMYMLAISQTMLITAGISYLAIGVVHGTIVVVHTKQSIRRGRLSFGHDGDDSVSSTYMPVARRISKVLSRHFSSTRRIRPSVSHDLLHASTRSFNDQEIVAVASRFIHLIEIGFQTFQAHQLSLSIGSQSFNAFVVVVVMFNCWRAPLGDHLATRSNNPSKPILRLLAFLTLEVLVDFIITVLVPVSMMVPRFMQFDYSNLRYPRSLTYNDVWITSAVSEGRQIMVTSTMDYMSSLFPLISSIASLHSIKTFIRSTTTITSDQRSIQPTESTKQVLSTALHAAERSVTTRRSVIVERRFKRWFRPLVMKIIHGSKTMLLLNLVALLWSVCLLVFFFFGRTRSGSHIGGCQLPVNAWFGTKAACILIQINCYTRGISGSRLQMNEVLDALDRTVVRRVVFSHCPALEIPDVINEFRNLNAIATFNCTITSWSGRATMSNLETPVLTLVQLIDTNMTQLPPAIVHESVPCSLNLIVYNSNLSVLPDNLGEVWKDVRSTSLSLEYTSIRQLPATFNLLRATKVSLHGSPITSLSFDMFGSKDMVIVRLSKTLISSLPNVLDISRLSLVLAEDTLVQEIPPWLQDWAKLDNTATSLRGSPACEDPMNRLLCKEVDVFRRHDLPYEVIAAQRCLECC